MALQLPVVPPSADAYHLAPHRIKRCTFRRLIDVQVEGERVYDVECLFPDRKVRSPWAISSRRCPCARLRRPPHLQARRGLTPPRADARRADDRRVVGSAARSRTSGCARSRAHLRLALASPAGARAESGVTRWTAAAMAIWAGLVALWALFFGSQVQMCLGLHQTPESCRAANGLPPLTDWEPFLMGPGPPFVVTLQVGS